MKYPHFKHIFPCFLTIILVICLTFPSVAAAKLYVNTGVDELSGTLSESYAIGSGDAEKLPGGTTYVLTGSELTTIEEGNAPVTTAAPGEIHVGSIGTTTVSIKSSTVRVGLYYYYSSGRDTALDTCRVSNYVGSGFEYGYYDSSRVFHPLGRTAETSLTVMKDTNISVDAGTVGCYHIKLEDTYSSFDEASAAASKYAGGFPAYYNGTYHVLVGHYKSRTDADAAVASLGLAGTAFSASNRCVVVTKTGTTDILFEFDCGSARSLALRPISSGTKAVTSLTGGNRYYGDFVFLRYNGDRMTVVNYVNIEDYTKGVVPYEMSASWPKEALKAQAMCARTYAAANFNQYGAYGFDVTNDTYSQVYRGLISANTTTNAAVDETAGLYITYKGTLCNTFFFSSDGGATESSENVWATELPYLRGRIDPYEADVDFGYKSWSADFTPAEITAKLKARGYSIGTITAIDAEYTDVGNMKQLTFYDADGRTVVLTKGNTYSALGLRSIHFTIEYDESTGKYHVEGGGWGHNVGMSQWGAYSMAAVHGMDYAHIICFYYTDVDLSKGVYAS